MATADIIAEVSKPTFYERVSYLSLGVAQNVASEDPGTANHENRVNYSARIFRGEEDSLLLAMHVVSSNPTIQQTVEAQGGDAVPDGDIQFALASIWDARANSFAAAPSTV
jgi:hypothetical protein